MPAYLSEYKLSWKILHKIVLLKLYMQENRFMEITEDEIQKSDVRNFLITSGLQYKRVVGAESLIKCIGNPTEFVMKRIDLTTGYHALPTIYIAQRSNAYIYTIFRYSIGSLSGNARI